MTSPSFVAGAAALPITPTPQQLDGRVYLGGYGGYEDRPAAGVHDDLFARALVIGDGATTVALIALDLVGMSNRHIARIRRAVARRLEMPDTAVLVACTHTHAGPDLQGPWGGVSSECAAHIRRQTVRAAVQAAAERAPATLWTATTTVPGRTVNRRGWPRTDETMTVLQARDGGRGVIATLVNFAAHPTVTEKGNVHISRDFPGALVDAIESDAGGTAMFVNADEGDVIPNVGGGFEVMQEYGSGLAQAASGALDRATELEPPLRLTGRRLDVPLALLRLRLPPGPVVIAMLAALRGLASLGVLRRLARRYRVQDRAFVIAGLGLVAEHPVFVRAGAPHVRTRVSRLRIGEGLDALAAPGEVLTNLGLSLRGRLAGEATMFLGLTNDTLGYFVPPDEWMSGRNDNYEESVSMGRQAAPTLEREALRLLGG
jgi:hypothetical protein